MQLDVGTGIDFGTNVLDVEIPEELRERVDVGIKYMNDAFGGMGITPSMSIMFTGGPGAGKTTQLLFMADAMSRLGLWQPYFNSNEESPYQIAVTAERLSLMHGFALGEESHVPTLIENCNKIREKTGKPVVLIVDSLQTLWSGKYADRGGGTRDTIRCLEMLTAWAKQTYNIVICIGQVNKDGKMAGSNKLKHIVDAHLHLNVEEKDEDLRGARVLETLKNRFGGAAYKFWLHLNKEGFTLVADNMIDH